MDGYMLDYAAAHTKSVSVTGLPALLIILVLLALLITGVVVVVRAVGRKAKSKI
jgi:F0F1-type ATP synthase assembly protein I